MRPFFLYTIVAALLPLSALAQEPEITDGNSAFATNLLATMTMEQYAYYDKVFTQMMEHESATSNYAWKTGDASGQITTAARFTTKSRAVCRPFSESYTVKEKSQTLRGVACRRADKKSWCKLRPGTTYDCRFEPKGGLGGMIEDGTVTVNRWNTKIDRFMYKMKSWSPF